MCYLKPICGSLFGPDCDPNLCSSFVQIKTTNYLRSIFTWSWSILMVSIFNIPKFSQTTIIESSFFLFLVFSLVCVFARFFLYLISILFNRQMVFYRLLNIVSVKTIVKSSSFHIGLLNNFYISNDFGFRY